MDSYAGVPTRPGIFVAVIELFFPMNTEHSNFARAFVFLVLKCLLVGTLGTKNVCAATVASSELATLAKCSENNPEVQV